MVERELECLLVLKEEKLAGLVSRRDLLRNRPSNDRRGRSAKAKVKEATMLVRHHMTKEPITVELDDLLSQAAHKMKAGGFRRLPVVSDGKLVGIVTERDLREHRGQLEHTKINGVMTENLFTVSPEITLEEAAQIMLEQQIGGLPVIHEGRLIGIITRQRRDASLS